ARDLANRQIDDATQARAKLNAAQAALRDAKADATRATSDAASRKAAATQAATASMKDAMASLRDRTSGDTAGRRGISPASQARISQVLDQLEADPAGKGLPAQLRAATTDVVLDTNSKLGKGWKHYKQFTWYVSAARAPARWGMDALFDRSNWSFGHSWAEYFSNGLGGNSGNASNVTGTFANVFNMFAENAGRFRNNVDKAFWGRIGGKADALDTVSFAAWGGQNVVDLTWAGTTHPVATGIQLAGNVVAGLGLIRDSKNWQKIPFAKNPHPWVNPLLVGLGVGALLVPYYATQPMFNAPASSPPPNPNPTPTTSPTSTASATPTTAATPSNGTTPTAGATPTAGSTPTTSASPTTSSPPGTTTKGQPAGPGSPPTTGTPPGTGTGTRKPTSPAQIVVTAGDPRRDTLWGIAQANEGTLLTPAQVEAAHGENGKVVAALGELIQINPKHGFVLDLDGSQDDVDIIQPGWLINVLNPALN
ncbi:MAG TPA: LWXIA domain-containing protein, partial [Burkholderiaceae bacterium]